MTPRQRYYLKNRTKEVAASRRWNQENPTQYAAIRRRYYWKHRNQILVKARLQLYGLTPIQYGELKLQFPMCGICRTKTRKLQIDHDHQTKKIRGRLCANCNTGIGLLKESPEIIRRAIKYLTNAK